MRAASSVADNSRLTAAVPQSVTFSEPSAEAAAAYGYTWDTAAAYGESTTPIFASYPPYQWPVMS